jgi:hypothetical protein
MFGELCSPLEFIMVYDESLPAMAKRMTDRLGDWLFDPEPVHEEGLEDIPRDVLIEVLKTLEKLAYK